MMKKTMILALFITGFALTSNAQENEKKKTVIELPQWVKNIKISGYGMLQYQFHLLHQIYSQAYNI